MNIRNERGMQGEEGQNEILNTHAYTALPGMPAKFGIIGFLTMKKAGRFGRYGEQKRRERFKEKQPTKVSSHQEKIKTEKRRRKRISDYSLPSA